MPQSSANSATKATEDRVAAYDWQLLANDLDNYGWAILPTLLSQEECRSIADIYSERVISEARS